MPDPLLVPPTLTHSFSTNKLIKCSLVVLFQAILSTKFKTLGPISIGFTLHSVSSFSRMHAYARPLQKQIGCVNHRVVTLVAK